MELAGRLAVGQHVGRLSDGTGMTDYSPASASAST
jgi:hypothetical protein